MAIDFDPTLATDTTDTLSPILAMGLITAGCAWDSDSDDPSSDSLDFLTFSDDPVVRR